MAKRRAADTAPVYPVIRNYVRRKQPQGLVKAYTYYPGWGLHCEILGEGDSEAEFDFEWDDSDETN